MVSTAFAQQMQTLNMGIDFFCIIELLIILRHIHKHTQAIQEYVLFRYIIAFTLLAFVGDGMSWLVNGQAGIGLHILNYLANFLYMTCQLISAMLTFIFFYWIIYGRVPSRKICNLAFNLPFLAVLLITYTTPWTGLVFIINQQNVYQRGILLPLMSLITLAYILAGSFLGAVHIKKEVLQDRKRRLQILACYCIPVILGSLIQTTFYGISLVLPCSAVALFMVFINEQDLKISVDSLTGLNNRGCFDRYLNEQLESGSRDDLGLIMIDVNNFKKINDRFGHIKGDSALQTIADILRRATKNRNVFLARYGGDEFTYILHTSQISMEEVLTGISKEVDLFNETNSQPFEISLAIGSALYDKDNIHTAEQLIHVADEMMYENKRIMKQQNNSSENEQEDNSFLWLNKKKHERSSYGDKK